MAGSVDGNQTGTNTHTGQARVGMTGDELRQVALKYGSALRQLIRKSVQDPDQVESIVDDSLLAVWEGFDPQRGTAGELLFSVARKRTIDCLRKAAPPPSLEDEIRGRV